MTIGQDGRDDTGQARLIVWQEPLTLLGLRSTQVSQTNGGLRRRCANDTPVLQRTQTKVGGTRMLQLHDAGTPLEFPNVNGSVAGCDQATPVYKCDARRRGTRRIGLVTPVRGATGKSVGGSSSRGTKTQQAQRDPNT